MSESIFLSMAKAIQYLGDAASAQQLLATLEHTLEIEVPQISSALESKNFEMLQKILHQLKGFAPVFCSDRLVSDITHTESLCKHIDTLALQATALGASTQLLTDLKSLLLEVKVQLQQAASASK